jgi:hypothetical protein
LHFISAFRPETGQQTIENQRRALDEIASRASWEVVEVYPDEVNGTKGVGTAICSASFRDLGSSLSA